MEDEQTSLENFLNWATQLGISDTPHSSSLSSSSITNPSCLAHSLIISYFPNSGGRGLAAARDLRKGEMVLRVPKLVLMTRDYVCERDQKVFDAFKLYPSLSPTQALAVCLLAELNKGRKSFWYPYLMQLPRSYDTLASFGPFETKALQVNDAIWLTEKVISKSDVDWRKAVPVMQLLKLKARFMTFKAWLWASATISSRTLHIPWDAAGCLCPVGDFFNYAAPGEELAPTEDSVNILDSPSSRVAEDLILDGEECDACSGRLTDGGYEEDLSAYCFYAKRNYRKGEQVLLSYGTYTNLELLEHYGFLLNENPNDKVFLPMALDISATHSWPEDTLYIQQDGKPSFSLLSALRLWATPPNQRKSVGHLVFSGSKLSPKNELTVMKWLISNCHVILNSLPSTVEDDQSLLCAIDKTQKLQTFQVPNNLPSSVTEEFRELSASLGSCNGENETNAKRSIERWKLAIEWRLRYKITLGDCVSFCARTIKTDCTTNQNHGFHLDR